MTPTDSGIRTVIYPIIHENGQIIPIVEPTRIYENGDVVNVTPPVIVTEGGWVTSYDVLTRTELSDELVIVEVT